MKAKTGSGSLLLRAVRFISKMFMSAITIVFLYVCPKEFSTLVLLALGLQHFVILVCFWLMHCALMAF